MSTQVYQQRRSQSKLTTPCLNPSRQGYAHFHTSCLSFDYAAHMDQAVLYPPTVCVRALARMTMSRRTASESLDLDSSNCGATCCSCCHTALKYQAGQSPPREGLQPVREMLQQLAKQILQSEKHQSEIVRYPDRTGQYSFLPPPSPLRSKPSV